jgi:hypothetical protein
LNLSAFKKSERTSEVSVNSSPLDGVIAVCPAYSAWNTLSATVNTVDCTFSAPAGVSLLIADCASAGCGASMFNDQYIRLKDKKQVTYKKLKILTFRFRSQPASGYYYSG